MNASIDKNDFRKKSLANLRKARIYRYADSKRVQQKIERLIRIKKPRSVLFFLPMNHEVNIMPTILKMRKRVELLVPFMVDDSFKMVAYRLPLKRAKYGILQTKNSIKKIEKTDMMIVPILGVDSTFRRVGFGKGMYDRFYERLKVKPEIVFVQTRLQQNPTNITQDFDIQANYLITSKQFLKIRA